MKFPALDKAVADDDLRESLSYVYVDKEITFASDAQTWQMGERSESDMECPE